MPTPTEGPEPEIVCPFRLILYPVPVTTKPSPAQARSSSSRTSEEITSPQEMLVVRGDRDEDIALAFADGDVVSWPAAQAVAERASRKAARMRMRAHHDVGWASMRRTPPLSLPST